NNAVYAIALQSDQRAVIAGDFTSINTYPRNRVARLLTTGQIDQTFASPSGADNTINAVGIQPADGRVVVAGGFASFDGVSRSGIARLTTNGVLDASFDPGTGINPGAAAANP